jgi:uncharacterized protein (TIGR02246 family)
MGSTWSYLDITALGRQEDWEDSPEGYPQSPRAEMPTVGWRNWGPYQWWNLHDEYDAPTESEADTDARRADRALPLRAAPLEEHVIVPRRVGRQGHGLSGVRGAAESNATNLLGIEEWRGRVMSDQTRELNKPAEDWAAAELDGDTASFREIMADDFVAVGPRGFVLSGEQRLNRHESGSLKYGSFGLDEVEVRSYREAAIVVCRQTADGVYEDENGRYDIDERFRATLVFVRQQGDWRLAGLQLSPILGRPDASR